MRTSMMIKAFATGEPDLPACLVVPNGRGGRVLLRLPESEARRVIGELHAALGEPEPWPDEVVETVPVPDAVRGPARA